MRSPEDEPGAWWDGFNVLNFARVYKELESLYASAGRDPESFRRLQTAVERADRELSAMFQEMTSDYAERLLSRLRCGEDDLSDEDLSLLRAWISGDSRGEDAAESDSLLDRLGELQRTLGALADFGSGHLSLQNLNRVRALLRRSRHLTPEIAGLLERAETVRRLDEALGAGGNAVDTATLSELLHQRLHPESE